LLYSQDVSMKKTIQPSHADEARTFEVTSDKVELPRGSVCTVRPGVPVEAGDLIAFQIGSYQSIGSWTPGLGGIDGIRQPHRPIALTAPTPARIVGRVVTC